MNEGREVIEQWTVLSVQQREEVEQLTLFGQNFGYVVRAGLRGNCGDEGCTEAKFW